MLHKNVTLLDRHAPHNFEYATAEARVNATGFVEADLHKLALQTDTHTLWILVNTTPTWAPASAVSDDTTKVPLTSVGAANGVAPLDATSKVPASYLPSSPDDVIVVDTFASLPVTGATGKIYITANDNKPFRWSGTAYVAIGGSSAGGWLTPTTIKVGTYSAEANQLVRCNSTGGSFTITLPAGSADGALIGISDTYSQTGAHPILVAPSGGEYIEADAGGLTLDVPGATVVLSFTTATGNWKIIDTPAVVFGAQSGANVFTGTQSLSDNLFIQAMVKDCGLVVVDKGNSGTAAENFDYTQGSVQTSINTGTHTITTSNWPSAGNLGYLLLMITNAGAYAISWPMINWVKPDGVTTTSIATYLAANTNRTTLQTSGVDQILLWSRDAGTTIYGKLI